MRWSKQPLEQAENESTEQNRWKLVDDFVANFNDHRANLFSPPNTFCVDASMSHWYGQGGHWINHGLSQCVAIACKPENGCKIQNAACGCSGVMLRLKLVKGIDLVGEDENNDEPNESSLLHGTQVLKSVVSNRIVCAASYSASVGAAKEQERPMFHWCCQDCHKSFFRSRTSRVLNSTNVVIPSPSLRILRTNWILLWLRSRGWIENAGTSLRRQGLSQREYLTLAAAGAK